MENQTSSEIPLYIIILVLALALVGLAALLLVLLVAGVAVFDFARSTNFCGLVNAMEPTVSSMETFIAQATDGVVNALPEQHQGPARAFVIVVKNILLGLLPNWVETFTATVQDLNTQVCQPTS